MKLHLGTRLIFFKFLDIVFLSAKKLITEIFLDKINKYKCQITIIIVVFLKLRFCVNLKIYWV